MLASRSSRSCSDPSTAGGAYLPTLCDQSIMVRGTGFVFLGGPPLVKAATGEDVTAEELGGADMHTSVSGTADYAVDSEEEGLELCREIAGTWARPNKAPVDMRDPEPPYYDPDELYGIIPDDIKKQFDIREVIARIVDGSLFTEFKPQLRRHDGHRLGIPARDEGRDPRQQRDPVQPGGQQGDPVHAAVRPRRHRR